MFERRTAPPRGEDRRVIVDGLVFRILSSGGHTDRPPIVLIHGIGVSHRYLSRLHRVLAHTRAVASVDLPGFGGLPKPTRDVDVPGMAAALVAVLDMLGAPELILVGHSMGAQWVVEAGIQRPDLVSSVVIVGPVADSEHRSIHGQIVALAKDTVGEPPRVNMIVFTDYLRCGVRWYLAQLRHMLRYPIEDRVAELSRPLLIVRGSGDPIAGLDWCRRLRDRASAADLVLVPGGRHVAQYPAPRAVATAILGHCG